MRQWIVLLGITVLAAACATAPVRPGDAEQIAPTRYAVAAADTGTIVITRDGGTLGMGCNIDVQIEGETVGSLWRRQSMTLHVPPGELIVAVKPRSPCGLMDSGRGLREIEVNLRANRPLYFRVGFNANGMVQFARTGLR
jgi:hypothetical protein